jgi:ribonuclease D
MEEVRDAGVPCHPRDAIRGFDVNGRESLLAALVEEPSQVDDRVDTVDGPTDGLFVPHIGLYRDDLADIAVLPEEAGELWPSRRDPDSKLFVCKPLNDVAAEEAGAAENRDNTQIHMPAMAIPWFRLLGQLAPFIQEKTGDWVDKVDLGLRVDIGRAADYPERMACHLHQGDLPPGLTFGDSVAIDTETMGLNPHRDRLCLVQLSRGDGDCHLVQFPGDSAPDAPNLTALLADEDVLKIFHFARFDIAALAHALDLVCGPVYCTKIASRLTRTFTDRHGLKDICRDLLGVEISKQQQSSDWGAEELSQSQIDYAASDVLHLHALKEKLDAILHREDRVELAAACFAFLPYRALLDLEGWPDTDIFAH